MSWNSILIVGLILIMFIGLKRLGLVSVKVARMYLKQGALVVDVRSAAEFKAGHLPEAVNIPLDELAASLPRSLADKKQVLLLHCLSGTRSGIARRMLKGMGYQNVFNLGSLARARKIAGSTGGN
jgi:phage shock protein E